MNAKIYHNPLTTGMSLPGRDPLYMYAYCAIVLIVPVDVARHEVSLTGTEQLAQYRVEDV